jgi:hypothetical protein
MALIFTLNALQLVAVAVVAPSVRPKLHSRSAAHMAHVAKRLGVPLAAVAAILTWFAYVFYTHSLLEVGTGVYVGGTVYGDMPFHLNVVNSFLVGVNRHASVFEGFKAVFFADAPLVYPVIPDWHVAVLVAAGRCARGGGGGKGVAARGPGRAACVCARGGWVLWAARGVVEVAVFAACAPDSVCAPTRFSFFFVRVGVCQACATKLAGSPGASTRVWGEPTLSAHRHVARAPPPHTHHHHHLLHHHRPACRACSSLHSAFMSTGILLVGSFLVLLLCFNLRLTRSRAAAVLAVVLTLLCGGWGGFRWLLNGPTWHSLRS